METTTHSRISYNRIQGSLVAGAAGDALGYSVEFTRRASILAQYGPTGITHYDFPPAADAKAFISDDTQMTLFTAEGLLNAGAAATEDTILNDVKTAYLRWYATQTSDHSVKDNGLLTESRLWAVRAPGNTCMSALRAIKQGYPVNNTSKGCGGIMRIAPAAIYGAVTGMSDNAIGHLAGEIAFITHHHPLSTIASSIAAIIIKHCLNASPLSSNDYLHIAEDALHMTFEAFPGIPPRYRREATGMLEHLNLAVNSGMSDSDVIAELGEGWVADEALIIALASVMRHPNDVHSALIMAVNHDGDSDSTGAIAGNIIGASLGFNAIPKNLADDVELREVIDRIAQRLANL